jgi:hypothetical protein
VFIRAHPCSFVPPPEPLQQYTDQRITWESERLASKRGGKGGGRGENAPATVGFDVTGPFTRRIHAKGGASAMTNIDGRDEVWDWRGRTIHVERPTVAAGTGGGGGGGAVAPLD